MHLDNENIELLKGLSLLLNESPDFITSDDMNSLEEMGISHEKACSLLVTAALGLNLDNDTHLDFYNKYLAHVFKQLDEKQYSSNAYFKHISIPDTKIGHCELKTESYKPFELFVYDDFIEHNGKAIPQIGFFDKQFNFPAILENERIWMTVTPNEINTIQNAIDMANGDVLTYGLGLGYYVYMTSLKNNVKSITAVEHDDDIIELFNKHILPQFEHPDKVNIIKADAFDYARNLAHKKHYDHIFTDLWHDVSDGINLYLRMKKLEHTGPHYEYWIEKTMKWYL